MYSRKSVCDFLQTLSLLIFLINFCIFPCLLLGGFLLVGFWYHFVFKDNYHLEALTDVISLQRVFTFAWGRQLELKEILI